MLWKTKNRQGECGETERSEQEMERLNRKSCRMETQKREVIRRLLPKRMADKKEEEGARAGRTQNETRLGIWCRMFERKRLKEVTRSRVDISPKEKYRGGLGGRKREVTAYAITIGQKPAGPTKEKSQGVIICLLEKMSPLKTEARKIRRRLQYKKLMKGL